MAVPLRSHVMPDFELGKATATFLLISLPPQPAAKSMASVPNTRKRAIMSLLRFISLFPFLKS